MNGVEYMMCKFMHIIARIANTALRAVVLVLDLVVGVDGRGNRKGGGPDDMIIRIQNMHAREHKHRARHIHTRVPKPERAV